MKFNTVAAAGDFIEVTCNGVDNIYAYAISTVTNGINFQ